VGDARSAITTSRPCHQRASTAPGHSLTPERCRSHGVSFPIAVQRVAGEEAARRPWAPGTPPRRHDSAARTTKERRPELPALGESSLAGLEPECAAAP
jgi:hypothetical protein